MDVHQTLNTIHLEQHFKFRSTPLYRLSKIPLIPYPVLMKDGKRSILYDEGQIMAKKPKILEEKIITGTFPQKNYLVFNSGCFPICLKYGLSLMELKRASDLILN